jgi:nickel-dependent lactate racemase
VAHDCRDSANMVYLGTTETGMPIHVNRLITECSLLIRRPDRPHPYAGYSGAGRASSRASRVLKRFKSTHSFPIYQYEPAMGFIYGNPFHEIALAAAKKAG